MIEQYNTLLSLPILKNHSSLLNSFSELDTELSENINLPEFINLDYLKNINKDNINIVIQIFDFFLVDKNHMTNYIINHCKLTLDPYEIDPSIEHMIDLPKFITEDLNKYCNNYSQASREQLLSYFNECIKINSVRWLRFLTNFDTKLCNQKDKSLIDYAATIGNLECLKFLTEKNYHYDSYTLNKAVISKNVNCFKFCMIYNFPISIETIYIAAEKGAFEVLKYLVENDEWITGSRVPGDFFTDHGTESKEHKLLRTSFYNDDYRICEYLLSLKGNYKFESNDLYMISKPGNINIFKLFVKYKMYDHTKVVDDFFNSLIINNKYEIIEYIYELGSFNYWNNNKIILLRDLMDIAGEYDSLEVMKFFHTKGIEWGKRTIPYCINGNSYRCLKYAHSNGCPIGDIDYINFKAHYLNIDSIKYINENIVDLNKHSKYHYNLIKSIRDIECFEYLKEIGFKFKSEYIDLAVNNDRVDLFKFYLDNNINYTDDTYEKILKCRLPKCLIYLLEDKNKQLSDKDLIIMINSDNIGGLRYVHENSKFKLNNDLFKISCKVKKSFCYRFFLSIGYTDETNNESEKSKIIDDFDY